jgi:hypothetical protein
MLVMMEQLADIADAVDANNEVMVRVASAYEACKRAVNPVSPPSRPKLSIVTTAVLLSSVGDVA